MNTGTLVLASHSPRRRDLLTQAGFQFETAPSEIVEKLDRHLTIRELAAWNAVRKGLAVANRFPERVVLAADTLVALDGDVIGKPRDLAEAKEILGRLSGKVHEVCTAVFLCHRRRRRSVSFTETSFVRFRVLDRAQIEQYVSRIDPLDKAGAYAAQGDDGEIIAGIDGSFSNVVGLPLEKTIPALRELGISRSLP